MRTFVAGHEAVTASEFVELALGIDRELFAGVPGESAVERSARLDVAREVLRELRQTHPQDAAYAEALMRTAPLPQRGRLPSASVRRVPSRKGAAA